MKKRKSKGSALFVALMFSFISLLIIAGLVVLWYRLNATLFPIKTYSSVREAAAGGINLVVSLVNQNYFFEMEEGRCPSGTVLTSNATVVCCRINLKFRLLSSNDTNRDYLNPIEICLLGYQIQPGFEVTGVAYTPQSAKLGKNYVYGLNSTALGPGNVTAYVEAVYVR